ncbi:MAG: sigma-70 family RNA polymerase sigma factor [Planctomycetes bacterium]|nr:sigma-70 family RNA polymerase sigma factor [Planctomycetota bacterium]
MTEDDQLMIRIQSGDSRAFEELVDRYQAALIGFFYRNTHDRQASEDLTQETLLRVFNQAYDYIPLGSFRAWMYRIGRNLMIDSIRKQSHDALVKAVLGKKEDEDDALARLAGEVLPPDQKAYQRELFQLVDQLLDEVPEEQRLTFTLHHYSGLTLSEVAEVMESSLPTTKSRLRLTREKLQKMLAERGITDPKQPDKE